jgi:hypothetical protein
MAWDDADMFEAWSAGYRFCAERAAIVDGELWLPNDRPSVEGLDHREACGFWLGEYEMDPSDDRHSAMPQTGSNLCVCGHPADDDTYHTTPKDGE